MPRTLKLRLGPAMASKARNLLRVSKELCGQSSELREPTGLSEMNQPDVKLRILSIERLRRIECPHSLQVLPYQSRKKVSKMHKTKVGDYIPRRTATS